MLGLLLPGLLLLLCACEPAPGIPAEDLGLELRLPAGPVTPGRAFPLTVVARWSKAYGELAPTLQLERAFPPLLLELEQVERREDSQRVEEARTYRAYAMTRQDVTLAPATWAPAPAAAPAVRAATPRSTVRVRPEVDAADAQQPEVPLPTLQAPRPRALGWLAVASVLLLLALEGLWLRRRRRAQAARAHPAVAAPVPGAARTALEALAALEPAAQLQALAARVRAALAQAGLPATSRTTPQTLALAPSLRTPLDTPLAVGQPAHAALARVLEASDGVTYARATPTAAEATACRADAGLLLEALAALGATARVAAHAQPISHVQPISHAQQDAQAPQGPGRRA
ncbi:MAG: hypothetical protein ACKOSS_11160 [Planctomycetia bacterium]